MRFVDENLLVDQILQELGKEIRLGIPLGIGKPNSIVNALYRRAKADPSIHLTLLTALSLKKPRAKNELEKRFLDPFLQRIFGNYPDLEYEVERQRLPPNVRVIEFYIAAGSQLNNSQSQQNYMSVNYTHAARDLVDRGVNVIAQLVAPSSDGKTVSLSCNPDVTLDIIKRLEKRPERRFLFIAQVSHELPYLYGDAVVPTERFDHLLDNRTLDFNLFSPPKRPVSLTDYFIGLYASTLIKDGGTIQVGIGSLGDALVFWLLLRHQNNVLYREIVKQCGILDRFGLFIKEKGELGPFYTGLFASTEMFVDSLMHLVNAGIIKREVDGAIIHAGFYLGPRNFYTWLRKLPEDVRKKIQMNSVSTINQLYGHEELDRQHLKEARFVNTCFMMTLFGGAVSDALEDGRVVSGVGGQYNFVAMAHELSNAHSIIQLRSTRKIRNGVKSNVVYHYGHLTIPRHLRDIVITEYGMAPLRARTDAEVARALIEISDSRFQRGLVKQAQKYGKLESSYEIPQPARNNTPEALHVLGSRIGKLMPLPSYPFGTDLTEEEQALAKALKRLKKTKLPTLSFRSPNELEYRCLERMGILHPKTLKERLYRALVLAALKNGRLHTS